MRRDFKPPVSGYKREVGCSLFFERSYRDVKLLSDFRCRVKLGPNQLKGVMTRLRTDFQPKILIEDSPCLQMAQAYTCGGG